MPRMEYTDVSEVFVKGHFRLDENGPGKVRQMVIRRGNIQYLLSAQCFSSGENFPSLSYLRRINSVSRGLVCMLEEANTVKTLNSDEPTIAPLSARVTSPSVITGDLPSGWMAFNSGGARLLASR